MNSGTRGKTIGGRYRKSDHRAGKSLSGVPDLRSERRKREIIPTDFSAPERSTGGRAYRRSVDTEREASVHDNARNQEAK